MIKGRENLKEWFLANGIVNFYVRDAAGQTAMFTFKKDGVTEQDAVNAMFQALQLLTPGRYYIDASAKHFSDKANATQRIKVPFEHVDGSPSTSGIGGPQVDVHAEIQKGIAEYERNREIKDLKEKCEKLEKEKKELENKVKELEKSDPITRMIGRAEPILNVLIDRNMPSKEVPAIGEVSADDFTSRLEKAFETWDEPNEATKLVIVEKVAKMSKEDPETYKMARGMLFK